MRLKLAALAFAALATPAVAGDERPEYQLLEGIEACLMGAGAVEATSDILTKAGWTVDPDTDPGVVYFLPGVGSDTYAKVPSAGGDCYVDSIAINSDGAAGMLELFLADGDHGISVTATGTNAEGCATQTLSNGTVVELSSGGEIPYCDTSATSALRFLFSTGG
jgi:hypothetical protein